VTFLDCFCSCWKSNCVTFSSKFGTFSLETTKIIRAAVFLNFVLIFSHLTVMFLVNKDSSTSAFTSFWRVFAFVSLTSYNPRATEFFTNSLSNFCFCNFLLTVDHSFACDDSTSVSAEFFLLLAFLSITNVLP
jgi:hypothetical protein